MTKLKILLLVMLLTFSNNNHNFKSPMILGDDYEFRVYEHPKCRLRNCLQSLPQNEYNAYEECKSQPELWEKDKKRYGLEEEEALSICIYTYDSKQISNTLSKGDEGEYGCFTEYLNSGLHKIWNYSRYYNMSTFSNLYTGIGLEDAKRANFIDGTKCLLKKGDHIIFPSYGSTSASLSLAKQFASNVNHNKGGMVFNIKTLKSKTKGILIQRLSFYQDESEYLFPPGSKFEVISDCKIEVISEAYDKPQEPLYYVELQEIDEFVKEYKTQLINGNEDKIKDYTRICTQCNSEVHNFCKYCEEKDKCSECYAGYIPDEKGLCVKCSDNCLKCDSKELNKCTDCFNGYGLIDKSCQKCSDDNCIKCNNDVNKCLNCKKGFTLFNGKCEKLDTFCETYDSNRQCTKCIGATYLEEGKCKECNDNSKIQNCAFCSKDKEGKVICKNCFPGFMQNYDTCIKNEESFGCETGIAGRCLQCEDNYILYNNNCYKCPFGCLKCELVDNDLNCLECYSGYALNSKFNCDECPIGCGSCILSNGVEKCTSCLPGYMLNDGQCDDCKLGCGECDANKVCSHCSKKVNNKATTLDIKSNTCITCEEGCERCRFNSGKYICDECSYGYVLKQNGECQKCSDLIESCIACEYNKDNQLKCVKCDNNNNLKNGECKKCQLPECDICELDENNNQMCLACTKHILSIYNQYGLKNGKCELCDDKDCLCFLNTKKNTLECQTNSKCKSSFINNFNILSYLLLILCIFI